MKKNLSPFYWGLLLKEIVCSLKEQIISFKGSLQLEGFHCPWKQTLYYKSCIPFVKILIKKGGVVIYYNVICSTAG